jgi:protoporphyrinogen oxidase
LSLDLLIQQSNIAAANKYANKFLYSGTNVVGFGLRGVVPAYLKTKCWKYFPESNSPFYRSTVFSNYSRYNVPDHKKHWSLMVEVSESSHKRVNQNSLVEEAIQGALNTKMIRSRREVISVWTKREKRGYPTPFIGRDVILNRVLPMLEKHSIYSRGRFGAWKYEGGNQDHSLMQGVEAVDRILSGKREITVYHPEIVNKR